MTRLFCKNSIACPGQNSSQFPLSPDVALTQISAVQSHIRGGVVVGGVRGVVVGLVVRLVVLVNAVVPLVDAVVPPVPGVVA